jgi:hypothetical protein
MIFCVFFVISFKRRYKHIFYSFLIIVKRRKKNKFNLIGTIEKDAEKKIKLYIDAVKR